jgi:hypothetical protein
MYRIRASGNHFFGLRRKIAGGVTIYQSGKYQWMID